MINAEIHYPLDPIGLEDISLIVFSDVGRLQFISQQVITDSITENTDPLVRGSVGVGFRYNTQIGPLALDIGVNPSPISERGEQLTTTHVSFGSF